MKRVFLVGYMGVGKSTIGKLLSVELGVEFVDLDKYIEKRYRKSIKDIFDERGENGFRKIEYEMLREAGTFQNVLISTGGGTPCFYDNMNFMNQQGITVYIKASVEELTSRLLASKNERPLIQGKTPAELKEFISQHLTQRQCYYSKSQIIYENKQLITLVHVDETVRNIKELLQPYL
ncbi:MAG: shikimate kinase [Dysgonamonadaceae bacterium]|nr:shikimate kinase [Dysgonamonadaceae bacterium]MDD4727612.1 shikimate kinase [Dysgonamonadaceae bacterium]